MAGHYHVTTTLDDRNAAERLGTAVVGERLAACAQVLGPVASTYRWRGAVEHAQEWYCHFKTTGDRLSALEARIKSLHPYEVPEIVAVAIAGGNAAYLRWIEECVSAHSPP